MLYHLLTPLSEGGDIFNLFRYITFRAGGALMTALIFAFLFGRPDFLDLALAYALINFIGVLAVLEFFRTRAVRRKADRASGQ